jgi:hypothetical protein
MLLLLERSIYACLKISCSTLRMLVLHLYVVTSYGSFASQLRSGS